ncbi:hypothetical protein ACIQV2_20425 [Streptomyces globosus]|uniref:hypothetical protein n=1 Tax=Streptomyces globosus TaxID=68209 RepID=UPI0038129C32
MGGRTYRAGLCRRCGKPLVDGGRRRPKRFCSRWHRIRHWISNIVEAVMDSA